jgi:peroxiredoxin Q/BCP
MPPDNDCWPHSDSAASVHTQGAVAYSGRGTFVPLPRSLGMLSPGDPAPDFDLQGTADGGAGAYRLSAATNRAPAVVAFAPGDASDSRPLLTELAQTDWASVPDAVAVFGVLPAGIDDCQSLASALSLPYPLLADTHGVAAQFGVREQDGSVQRAAFVVDQRCRVRVATAFDDTDGTAPDLETVLRGLAEL